MIVSFRLRGGRSPFWDRGKLGDRPYSAPWGVTSGRHRAIDANANEPRGEESPPAASRAQGSRLAPVEDELALGEVPAPVELAEGVEVAEGGDHDLAAPVFGVEVVGERVALSGRARTGESHGALAVEVRRDLVAVEVVEDGCERFSSL